MNEDFLSWFLNVVTIKFRISRGRRLIMDGNIKGYEVAEYIYTKDKENPQMISTLKNVKYI